MSGAIPRERRIHFVLAANNRSSLTRVTAEFATRLIGQGCEVTVSVPYFSYWDFALWELHRRTAGARPWQAAGWWLRWLLIPLGRALLARRPWHGITAHRLDPRVRVHRYWCVPWAGNMPDADVLIALQGYLIPHLLYLPATKGRILGGIRGDYRDGIQGSAWWSYFTAFEPRLRIPYFAVSEGARASAESLGIEVQGVVHNGVNAEEFTDGGRRGEQDPVTILVFCAPGAQKGVEDGCAAIERLRARPARRRIHLCSIGEVPAARRPLFDVNHGYCTGAVYAQAYREADILLYPSVTDGFPAPPLEAMASGCAVVGTRVPGLMEYGREGENCLLVEPRDVEGMVARVSRLIEDHPLRDRLREAGLRTARAWSWERATDELLAFLDATAAQPPTGASCVEPALGAEVAA